MPPTEDRNDVEDTQGAPPATTRDGLLGADAADLLDEAFALPEEDKAGDEPDPPAPGEGPAAAPDEAPAPAAEVKPAPPKRTMVDYVEMLAAEPGRATEVPEKERAAAIERATRLRQTIADQTARDILARVQAQQAADEQLHDRIGTFLELHEAADYEALAAEAKRDPEGRALFDRYLAAQHAEQTPAPAPAEAMQLRVAAREAMGWLRDDETARSTIMANYQAGKYPTTPAGLETLRADVRALISAPAPKRTPEERSAAARARGLLPKVEASPGAPPPSGRQSRKELLETPADDLIAAGLATT